jgi:hypothetical protein
MYVGYVFVCSKESLHDCLRQKLFACSGETIKNVEEVGVGSVVFLFNTDSKTLIGPFTASGLRRTGLEPGTWKEVTDEHSVSENIRVKWENLHELRNAQDRFPFLKDIKACKLSQFQTQDMLNALDEAPLFSMKQSSNPERRRSNS